MKIEEYPCVKNKRAAQEKIHLETRNLALEEQLARHQRSHEELKNRRAELMDKSVAKAGR